MHLRVECGGGHCEGPVGVERLCGGYRKLGFQSKSKRRQKKIAKDGAFGGQEDGMRF